MSGSLSLFEGYGVELEYMIIDRGSLNVLPVCDEVIKAVTGGYDSDVEQGDMAWSNELVLHVIELKTNGPAASLDGLSSRFQEQVGRIRKLLEPMGGRLMPTAMHPWMNPARETRLWPHEYSPIYESYNRVFDCRGHGWANLQSTHVNLSFRGDEEFGRLHAAIRLVLPILPALAASSPIVEMRTNGILDNRLHYYRKNQARVPSVGGSVIPEPVFTQADYDREIFQPIYREIEPLDPDGTLRQEFLNSRGAIARFSRGSIEIRLLDVQECPKADLAILSLIVAVLKALVHEEFSSAADQRALATEPMAAILNDCIYDAEEAEIAHEPYLEALGMQGVPTATAGEVWKHLAEKVMTRSEEHGGPLSILLERGPLARRIVEGLPPSPRKHDIAEVYIALCNCLDKGEVFVP
ncbi:glutamate--cysteine ligase [Candidatus Poribacteria bacterium]|nr:glutamate--cysteine ligase [Candidatus Poribacteria bacterium]